MRTLRHAADLLGNANTLDGQRALAESLGFDVEHSLPVDIATRVRLGLPPEVRNAHIISGRGALRALLLEAPDYVSLRELMTKAAASLNTRTSHVLWILIGSAASGDEVGLACWSSPQRTPRLVALSARRRHIVASDAETLCSLAASSTGSDLLVHARWCDLLGREALSRKFYRILEQRVNALADSLVAVRAADRRDLALLYVSRLLFLSFLEAKGWLDRNRAFLVSHFDDCMSTGGDFHRRVLLPLFFGTLNTTSANRSATSRALGKIPFLNGGLFSRGAIERRNTRARFSDEAFGALFEELLGAHRFTARETEDHWADAAVDPEMLGRAFESLMASRERRTSGAFYTPHALVSHVTERALSDVLAGGTLTPDDVRVALGGNPITPAHAEFLRERLRTFTVLDPACGSGAFLVHTLERVSDLLRATGDTRSIAAIRRDVLARCIHGVDLNPTAVWLCELRLWLSVVIESEETRMSAVPPLPNLDWNIRVGDTLAGESFSEPPSLVGPATVLASLRARYARAIGPRKAPLRAALGREELKRALAVLDRELKSLALQRRERLSAHRTPDMFGERTNPDAASRAATRTLRLRSAALRRERRRLADGGALPFSFPSHFGNVHNVGGFDLVIGNPPWVRIHNIAPETRAALRTRFSVYRNAAWEFGAAGANAGRGFASQVDLASLFVERSAELLAPHGSMALLLPSKLWRSLAGGGVRRLLGNTLHLRALEDWSEAPSSFDAAVYPSVVLASRIERDDVVSVAVKRRAMNVEWTASAAGLRLIARDAGSPLLTLPPDARAIFDRIFQRGMTLADSPFGRAMLGVKCGCNDAFTVQALTDTNEGVGVEWRGRKGLIESDMIRPLLRGDSVTPWQIEPSRHAIIWTHADRGGPLAALPSGAAHWLAPWKRQLVNRTDLRTTRTWWMLFRTESACSVRTRVVWSDFGRTPTAAVLPAGDDTVPLNSCYVVNCDDPVDAMTLTALLNSPLAAAWLNAIAEPARGGWHRYLAWTVSLLPLPRDWARARTCLAPLAESALAGRPPSSAELLAAACAAYRIRRTAADPLIAWCHPTA